jgi:hypothetical protein
LVEKTNFEETILNVKEPPLVHPFIPCIQLRLEEFHSKLLEMRPELSSTLFFCDYSSGRTTLEFAFTSQNPFFIEPIIESLSEIQSFVVHNNRITLFDICETIFVQLKDNGFIFGNEDSKKHDNNMLKLYQQLVEKVYTEARSSSGSKAEHILKDFKFTDLPKIMKDVQLIRKLPKKLEEKKRDTITKSEQLRKTNEEKNRKIKDFESLFYLSYTNNNFVTLPFISSMDREFKLDIQQIKDCDNPYYYGDKMKPSKSFLSKHEIIFETILQKLLGKEITESSIKASREPDLGDEEEDDKNDKENSVENDIFLSLVGNEVKSN